MLDKYRPLDLARACDQLADKIHFKVPPAALVEMRTIELSVMEWRLIEEALRRRADGYRDMEKR